MRPMKRYQSAREVLAAIEKALDASKPGAKATPLGDVLDVLYEGRHYFWIGIYLVVGNEVRRQDFRGPVPPCHTFAFGKGNVGTTGQKGVMKVIPDVTEDPTYSMCFREVKSEIVVPIRLVTRTIGVIDVESDQPNAFGAEDRVLLKRVALLLARFLTSKGKYIVRKAREADMRAGKSPTKEKHQPVSEKMIAEKAGASRKAAAGEAPRA
jgi:putative methionine-R-sulfoxide reductase with GAF domain